MINTAVKQKAWVRGWMLATLLTGATILSARLAVYIPPTPIPITFQVFAVLLSGLRLGRKWGAIAQLQYLALGMLNVPVFAKGGFGFASVVGLTGGYLLSYPIAAFVVGWMTERPEQGKKGISIPRQLLACAAGLAIIYGLGCSWFAAVGHQPLAQVVLQGALIFLAWDSVKALSALAVANGLRGRFSRSEH